MAQAKVGPLVLPWERNAPDEVGVILLASLVGAIVSTTLIYHYRRRK